jgi:hypothetical protein
MSRLAPHVYGTAKAVCILLVNSFEAYQNAIVAIRGHERATAFERPEATIAAA